MTTRILATRKERVLVTLLLALGVPCSAQLGVILAHARRGAALRGPRLARARSLGVMVAVGWLASQLLPGRTRDFVVELPPLRLPLAANVLVKTAARMEWYLKEALPLFVLGTLLLFVLDRLHLLAPCPGGRQPLVVGPARPPAAGRRGVPHRLPAPRLRGHPAVRHVAGRRPGHGPARGGHGDDHPLHPLHRQLLHDRQGAGDEDRPGHGGFIFPFAFAVGGLVRLLMRGLGWWERRERGRDR